MRKMESVIGHIMEEETQLIALRQPKSQKAADVRLPHPADLDNLSKDALKEQLMRLLHHQQHSSMELQIAQIEKDELRTEIDRMSQALNVVTETPFTPDMGRKGRPMSASPSTDFEERINRSLRRSTSDNSDDDNPPAPLQEVPSYSPLDLRANSMPRMYTASHSSNHLAAHSKPPQRNTHLHPNASHSQSMVIGINIQTSNMQSMDGFTLQRCNSMDDKLRRTMTFTASDLSKLSQTSSPDVAELRRPLTAPTVGRTHQNTMAPPLAFHDELSSASTTIVHDGYSNEYEQEELRETLQPTIERKPKKKGSFWDILVRCIGPNAKEEDGKYEKLKQEGLSRTGM